MAADPSPERRWVILSSRPEIADWDMEETLFDPGSDAFLHPQKPPRLSTLVLPRRICPEDPIQGIRPYIIAVDSGCVLLHATQGHGAVGSAYFLYRAHSGRVSRLPPVAARLALDVSRRLWGPGDPRPRRSVGLIADPRRAGNYVVVELHPTFDDNHSTLLYYSTDTDSWHVKDIAVRPFKYRKRWGVEGSFYDGVLLSHVAILSHNGKLWWFHPACGILTCDPFAEEVELSFIPLPSSCNMDVERKQSQADRHIIGDRCRILRPSQGQMCLLATHSLPGEPQELALGLWTLDDMVDQPVWELKYRVTFDSIRADDDYKVFKSYSLPFPAIIDPNDRHMVYLLKGSSLFALDTRERQVLSCEECAERSSHFMNAWELPSTLFELGPSHGMKALDEAMVETTMVHRPWIILMLVPSIEPDESVRILPGNDVLLEFADPPRPSKLFLRNSISPDQKGQDCFPYILATEPSGVLLFHATQGTGLQDTAFFLCNAYTNIITCLPDVPDDIAHRLRPRRSIGLIADPHHVGSYMIAQLIPTSSTCYDRLLYYSTSANAWGTKWLASPPVHKPWAGHGVFSHQGMLWWVDVAYGMLTCNPFMEEPHLRFVQLPHCRSQKNIDGHVLRLAIDEKRMVRVSEGKIRYVEIYEIPNVGPAVSMCTLVDEVNTQWAFEYQALFKEIWADETYKASELPQDKVPALAFVDPKNHGILYFFLGSLLFALDVRARRVLHKRQCLMDPFIEKFKSSRFINSWELALPEERRVSIIEAFPIRSCTFSEAAITPEGAALPT